MAKSGKYDTEKPFVEKPIDGTNHNIETFIIIKRVEEDVENFFENPRRNHQNFILKVLCFINLFMYY